MTLTLLPSQLELIKNIANNEGIKNYELEILNGKQKGDGYTSDIVLVSIISTEQTLKLVLKVASGSVKLREEIPMEIAFHREYFIYNEVFEHYKKLQKEYTEIPFESTQFYGHSFKKYEECLALENLKEKGFQLWDRKLPMNDQHIELTFQMYGKFHALSFITRYLYPDKYHKWLESIDNVKKNFYKDNFEQQLKKIIETNAELFNEERIKQKVLNLYKSWKDVYFLECEEKYSVLIHGDSWCNNFLYKYEDSEENTKPIDIRMLDFQLAIFTTPVYDLTNFLFTATDKQHYSKYRDYLALYHHTMASVLKKFNLDINTVYPYEILEDHWQKHAKYGLYCAILVFKAILVSADEILDMNDLIEDGCDFFESFVKSLPENKEYDTKIKELIEFYVDSKLI